MRQHPSLRSTMTRRRFLAGAGAGFVGLLAACSGPDTDFVDESESVEAAAATATPDDLTPTPEGTSESTTDQTDSTTTQTQDSPSPTPLTETREQASTGTSKTTHEPTAITIDFIPVVSRRLQMREISYDALLQVWNGEITDWNQLGEPGSHQVQRLSIDGSAGPMSLDHIDLNIEKLDDLAEFLHFQTGAIAFLPRQQIDFRFRHLRVDGTDYLIHPDDSNPLRTEVTFDARLPQHLDLIRSTTDGPDPVSMTWLGDIIYGRFVHKKLQEIGDFTASFWDIHPDLTWADITIGNLECSLSDTIPQPDEAHTFSFTTVTAAVEGLKLAEIDVLSRANNHSLNFGPAGMDDTTAVLDEAGIQHFGTGHNLDEARQAVVVEKNGITYAFLGYNGISDDYDGAGQDWAGTMPLEADYVIQDIERELAAGHVVIPYFHWGVEYVADPSEEQRYFAQLAIDHGASLVMGSHPHWVQAVETYRGKPIVYSLGNFIFDQAWSIETMQGMIAHVWMKSADVISIDLVPILIEDEHRPRIMGPEEAVPVLNRVWAASERLVVSG